MPVPLRELALQARQGPLKAGVVQAAAAPSYGLRPRSGASHNRPPAKLETTGGGAFPAHAPAA